MTQRSSPVTSVKSRCKSDTKYSSSGGTLRRAPSIGLSGCRTVFCANPHQLQATQCRSHAVPCTWHLTSVDFGSDLEAKIAGLLDSVCLAGQPLDRR